MKMKKISPKVSKIKRGDIRIYVNIKRANTHTEREKTLKGSRKLSDCISLASRALKKGYNTDADDDDEARRFLGVSSVFRVHRSTTTTTTTKRIVDVIERFVVVDDGRRRRKRRRREREKARFYRRGWCDDDYCYECDDDDENENDDAL